MARTPHFCIRLDPELKSAADAKAKARGLTLSGFIKALLAREVENTHGKHD